MHQKSRYGCQTCKIRRVKCDETLPFCNRCISTGRKCEGPSKHKSIFVTPRLSHQQRSDSLSRSSSSRLTSRAASFPLPNQLAAVPSFGNSEKRALSFFVDCAAPALAGHSGQDFWATHVPQVCHQNPLIRDAVLAVSTLYEKPLSNPFSWPTSIDANFSLPEHRQAFKWYTQSLNGVSELLRHPKDQEQLNLALTSCILFASIEIQQLNVVNSMSLLQCGYNLLSQKTLKIPTAGSTVIEDVILPMFVRQTMVLVLQGYSLPDDWLPANSKAAGAMDGRIDSLHDARSQLFLVMFDGFVLMKQAYKAQNPEGMVDLKNTALNIVERLHAWRTRFDTYVSMKVPRSLSEDRSIHHLNTNHHIATIWLTGSLSPNEVVYDTFNAHFGMILDHAASILSHMDYHTIPYTFEMGVIPPLYFTGWRCRDPQLRRRALQLLKRAPAQESLFHRDVLACALRKIIQIEEGLPVDADVERLFGTVPVEDARIRHAMVRWDVLPKKTGQAHGGNQPCLVYSRWMLEEGENGHLKEMPMQMAPL